MNAPRVEVIAEVGVNHNGDVERALKLVDVAVAAGADTVKFQLFRAEDLVTAHAPLAQYQQDNVPDVENQLQLLKQLELSEQDFERLYDYCGKQNIQFLASPFDRQSLNFLVSDLKNSRLKIASGEITNGPLLLQAAQSGCEVILSTGMATVKEIDDALAVLAYGYLNQSLPSSIEDCRKILLDPNAHSILKRHVCLLHCTSQYPTPMDQVNLRAMEWMAQRWHLRTGYSDHTEGIAVSLGAAALGACCIEKHFTLDKSLPGPDHRASLEPDELTQLVAGVRALTLARGDTIKEPQNCELSTQEVARKSLLAAQPIEVGQQLSPEHIACRRPGNGISPMQYWDLLSKPAQRAYTPNEPFQS